MDIKIFVDEDADIRLSRRSIVLTFAPGLLLFTKTLVRRDIAERGRDVMGVIQQYERFVKPAHEDFVRPVCTLAVWSPDCA